MVDANPSSWEELEASVESALTEIVWRLEREGTMEGGIIRTLPGIRAQVDTVCQQIRNTLEQRGRSYGEDVLFLLGEMGFVAWAVSKAMRILWSYTTKRSDRDRDDDWLDMAGYAILRMAVQRWKRENTP